MRVGRQLLFAPPDFTFDRLDLADAPATMAAFVQRIQGFYLRPARDLASLGHAFASGVLCCSAIDAVARYALPDEHDLERRFATWLKLHVRGFAAPQVAARFYQDFRHGLVPEGRIKRGGQFSLEANQILTSEDGFLIVNPALLIPLLFDALEIFRAAVLERDHYHRFATRLRREFRGELAAAR